MPTTTEPDHIAELRQTIDSSIAELRAELAKLEAAREALGGNGAAPARSPRATRSRSHTAAVSTPTRTQRTPRKRSQSTPSATTDKRRQRRPQRNVSALVGAALTDQPQTASQLAAAAGLENGTSVYRVLKSAVINGEVTQSELDGKRAYALAAASGNGASSNASK